MKTVLICHEDSLIDTIVTARWLASFSDLTGVIVIREKGQRMKTRIKREIERVGYFRFLDVLAFRLYYKLFLAKKDDLWNRDLIQKFCQIYPEYNDVPTLVTSSPNSLEAEKFLKETTPDLIIAKCKTLLKKDIFSLAKTATVVFHPGICPEYRNAHGCFWALAQNDFDKVGMTLLKIDEGIDTGPIYGYYSYDYDAKQESHIVIQTRVITENLGKLEEKLQEIHHGTAQPIDVQGRKSGVWGQPWLTKYWKIKTNPVQKADTKEQVVK